MFLSFQISELSSFKPVTSGSLIDCFRPDHLANKKAPDRSDA